MTLCRSVVRKFNPRRTVRAQRFEKPSALHRAQGYVYEDVRQRLRHMESGPYEAPSGLLPFSPASLWLRSALQAFACHRLSYDAPLVRLIQARASLMPVLPATDCVRRTILGHWIVYHLNDTLRHCCAGGAVRFNLSAGAKARAATARTAPVYSAPRPPSPTSAPRWWRRRSRCRFRCSRP